MDRDELRSKIPHGYGNIIAEKAGVNRQTVSNFLNGKTDNILVEIAALEVVAEFEQKRKGFMAIING